MEDQILAEQIAFYRAAASDYEYQRVDVGFDLVGLDELLTAIDAFVQRAMCWNWHAGLVCGPNTSFALLGPSPP